MRKINLLQFGANLRLSYACCVLVLVMPYFILNDTTPVEPVLSAVAMNTCILQINHRRECETVAFRNLETDLRLGRLLLELSALMTHPMVTFSYSITCLNCILNMPQFHTRRQSEHWADEHMFRASLRQAALLYVTKV